MQRATNLLEGSANDAIHVFTGCLVARPQNPQQLDQLDLQAYRPVTGMRCCPNVLRRGHKSEKAEGDIPRQVAGPTWMKGAGTLW